MTAPHRTAPIAPGEFRGFGPAPGRLSARVEIAGLAVEFAGLPDDLAPALAPAYGPFLRPANGAGRPLRLALRSAPIEYFLPPRKGEEHRVLTALDGTVFRAVSYSSAWWFDLDRLTGEIVLGTGTLDPLPRAIENILRSAVAWLAIERGGFFLHGAGIERGGRCYLFYGPSGAGKSTLAAMNADGRVLSDDLTLVLGATGGLVAASGPFRGTYRRGDPIAGSWPVAGFYRLRRDERTHLRADDGGCRADLFGNLPWIVDLTPRRPDLLDRVGALVAGARFRYLHFRREPDFWPVIDADRPE